MPLDLGGLLQTAAETWISSELGPQPVMNNQIPLTNQGFEIPFIDVIPQQPGTGGSCGSCGPNPVYKKVCGQYKWVTPKRRRKKALVTQTDLKGLAALKGVLGQGKLLETWIATHS